MWVGIGFSTVALAEGLLSVDKYLEEVRQFHQGYQGGKLTEQSSKLRKNEAYLAYKPAFFTSFQGISDSRIGVFTGINGRNTNTLDFSTGFSWLMEEGLQTKLSYRLLSTTLTNPNPQLISFNSYYDGNLVLDMSFPLWRNAGGLETKLQSESVLASYEATSYGSTFKNKQILLEAEQAYWRLVLAKEILSISEQGILRAKKICDWANRRATLGLGEQSDCIQARAFLEVRKLDAQLATDELNSATRYFNASRGIVSDQVPSNLMAFSEFKKIGEEALKRQGQREDVKAAYEQLKIAKNAIRLASEKLKPSLDLFSTVALNRFDNSLGGAISNGFNTDTPTYLAGIRYTQPLYGGVGDAVQKGLEKEEEAAKLIYEQKKFEQERDWNDLVHRFVDCQKKYDIAKKIEALQSEKWAIESARHSQGRSTVYQVLMFEQDFASAQMNRIRVEAERLTILSQMKLYRSQ